VVNTQNKTPNQGQTQTPKIVVVRASHVSHPFIRYYLIKGFGIVNDVVLGKPIKAVEAIGMYQDQCLETNAEEGNVVIIETERGYEYCGIVKAGAKSTIYIGHTPIELENMEVTLYNACEMEKAYELLNAHGLSIDSMILNPWRLIVPYAMATLMKFGYKPML
jgi:phosphoenolpyruvate synthase/pyruvate phosphate dikinase